MATMADRGAVAEQSAHRRAPTALTVALALAALLVAACSTDTVLASSNDRDPDPISMAIAALERIDPPAGSQVVVPTNTTIMGLDADTLARIASEGRADFILRELILSEPIEIESLDSPVSRTSTTGVEVDFIPIDSGIQVGQGRLVEARPVGDVTYLIVEGLWNS